MTPNIGAKNIKRFVIIFLFIIFILLLWQKQTVYKAVETVKWIEDFPGRDKHIGYTKLYTDPPGENDRFQCVTLRAANNPPICVYDSTKDDIWVSKSLVKSGTWEKENVAKLLEWLDRDPNLGFIDIGANIGVYTLSAASLGHQVLAVEPALPNIKRLQKAIYKGNLKDKVTLIRNAISSKREKVSLTPTSDKNKGNLEIKEKSDKKEYTLNYENPDADAIFMDDLLEVIPFQKAVMKIDVEGYEMHAFTHAEKLFSKIHIPIIFMEWQWFHMKIEKQVNKEISYKAEVTKFIDYMVKKGYRPYSTKMQDLLSRPWSNKWGNDIIWISNVDKKSYVNKI